MENTNDPTGDDNKNNFRLETLKQTTSNSNKQQKQKIKVKIQKQKPNRSKEK